MNSLLKKVSYNSSKWEQDDYPALSLTLHSQRPVSKRPEFRNLGSYRLLLLRLPALHLLLQYKDGTQCVDHRSHVRKGTARYHCMIGI